MSTPTENGKSGLSRRGFLGAAAATAAATAAAAAIGGSGVARAFGSTSTAPGERLVPPGNLGVQQFAVRDAITRLNGSVMGYLGGPNFPADPTDLGPLVPLPGGFRAVFEYLASVSYRGFEFFSFSQGPNGAITNADLRAMLDDNGLVAQGTHTGSLATLFNPATRGAEIERAHTLGLTMLGTAGDPSGRSTLGDNPANPNQIGWQTAADRANAVGALAAAEGMRWYWHVEQNGFQFITDTNHPELAHTHRVDWFAANTDPTLVNFEPDLLHAFAGRARFPDPVDGSLWRAFDFWKANEHRLVAWHVKDGSRLVPQPLPPISPFTQTIARTPTFTDVIYVGEGSIGNGYPVDPDPAVIGYRKLFDQIGEKGSRFYIAESDSGPGPASDPGRSLRWAKISAQYLLGLRAGPTVHSTSTAADGYDPDIDDDALVS